jgi:hypothetical protein
VLIGGTSYNGDEGFLSNGHAFVARRELEVR